MPIRKKSSIFLNEREKERQKKRKKRCEKAVMLIKTHKIQIFALEKKSSKRKNERKIIARKNADVT